MRLWGVLGIRCVFQKDNSAGTIENGLDLEKPAKRSDVTVHGHD